MPISTGAGIAIAAGVGAGGSVASSLIGSHAAGKAADAQAAAAEEAANLQAGGMQEGLDIQEAMLNESLFNQSPWIQSGSSAMANLDSLLGISPPTFANQGIPASGPIQFPQFSLNPGSPNPTMTSPGGNPWAPPNPNYVQMSPLSSLNGQQSGFMSNHTPLRGPVSTFPGGNPDAGTFGGNSMGPVPGTSDVTGTHTPLSTLRGGFATNNMAEGGFAPGLDNGPMPFPGNPDVNGFGLNNMGPSSQAPPNAPGQGAPSLSSLVNPQLGGFGSLMQPFQGQFKLPTISDLNQIPGYQFELEQGTNAINNSAAARGGLLSGGTSKALGSFAQGLASSDYNNYVNQRLTEYQTAYNQFQQQQANQYNRLANIAGLGQVSVGQLGGQLSSAGNSIGSLLLGGSQGIGQDIMAGANARASGYINQANAVNSGIGGLSGSVSLLSLLPYLNAGNAANPGTPPVPA